MLEIASFSCIVYIWTKSKHDYLIQISSTRSNFPQFIIDANADLDMAYDWVADQTGLDSFVHQQDAWDMFYDAYEKPLCLTDD